MPPPTHTEEGSSMNEPKQADEVRTIEGLMPCPFCGGAATFWGETPTCSRCDAMGPCRDEDVTREQNIAAWNRRATQAQQGEPDWRQAFERAMKQTWGMVNPLKPAGQPGSYWRGEHNGICGSLQTLRENFERELSATPIAPARQAVRMLTGAARDVLAERQRQVSAEGWTPEHDDEHDRGELARAAGCYAIVAGSCQGWSADTYSGVQAPSSVEDDHDEEATTFWPWDKEWWKPKNPRRDLVRAAALILAEIERLDRAALPLEQQEGGK